MRDQELMKLALKVASTSSTMQVNATAMASRGTPNAARRASKMQTTSAASAAAASHAAVLKSALEAKSSQEAVIAALVTQLQTANPEEAVKLKVQLTQANATLKTMTESIRKAKALVDTYLPKIMDAVRFFS